MCALFAPARDGNSLFSSSPSSPSAQLTANTTRRHAAAAAKCQHELEILLPCEYIIHTYTYWTCCLLVSFASLMDGRRRREGEWFDKQTSVWAWAQGRWIDWQCGSKEHQRNKDLKGKRRLIGVMDSSTWKYAFQFAPSLSRPFHATSMLPL